jgi:type VI protein secretion system component VasF
MTDPDTATGPESESEGKPRAQTAPGEADLPGEEYEQAMAKLHKMSAPHTFADDVEETIRRRSAGRFFGRKAFGDRVPFEVLAIVALALGLAVFLLIRSSQTGSLRYETQPEAPSIDSRARDVVPQLRPVDK